MGTWYDLYEVKPFVIPSRRFYARPVGIDESPLEDETEEAARTDPTNRPMSEEEPLSSDEAEWEGNETVSTTACDRKTIVITPPESTDSPYSTSSTVVLRRARRVNGRMYDKGEEVHVRRSRRLASMPRVSYKGTC